MTIGFSKYLNLSPLWELIILSALGAIIAQFGGDLAASKIKRITSIKDYGFIIPGHGGILDRFDSILFTAPFVYYFVRFFLYCKLGGDLFVNSNCSNFCFFNGNTIS